MLSWEGRMVLYEIIFLSPAPFKYLVHVIITVDVKRCMKHCMWIPFVFP